MSYDAATARNGTRNWQQYGWDVLADEKAAAMHAAMQALSREEQILAVEQLRKCNADYWALRPANGNHIAIVPWLNASLAKWQDTRNMHTEVIVRLEQLVGVK